MDDEYAYWPTVAQIMSRWGKNALGEFDRFARDEHHRVRRTVAESLGKMDLEEMPDLLPLLIDDRDSSVRWSASDSVVNLCKRPNRQLRTKAVALLVRSLADDEMHREYWWRASHTLAELAPTHPEALDVLLKVAKTDKHEDRRYTAARDLGTVGAAVKEEDKIHALVRAALVETIEHDPSDSVKTGAICGLELMALRGGAEALAVIEKSVHSRNQRVSMVAQEILERLQRHSEFRPKAKR
jgi:HEAT repeat protein